MTNPHNAVAVVCTGHPVKGSWVVGVSDNDGKIRLEVVAERSQVRLTKFIETYVRPGTWLHADRWKGYANGASGTKDILGAMGYRGLSVNHDQAFKEWVPKHRKFACTNTIEGNWNVVIAKTPKRQYGYKEITPYLRQVEWDREATDLWNDWWKAFQTCTSERVLAFHADLKELYTTDPNLPKEPHPILSFYARGYHGPTGNNAGTQSSKSKFHYAYCSTSNPNHYGCRKCDFYWNQFCFRDIDMVKEARKAAYEDEQSKKPLAVTRLSVVVDAMVEAINVAVAGPDDDDEEKKVDEQEEEEEVDVMELMEDAKEE